MPRYLSTSAPGALLMLCIAAAAPVWAHSMYQAAILLDFRGNTAEAELQLPLERLQAALDRPLSEPTIERDGSSIAEYILRNFAATLPDGRPFRVDAVDAPHLMRIEGAPYVVAHLRLVPPAGASADLFDLETGLLFDRVASQAILLSVRTDWRTSTFADDPQLVAVLRAGERTARIDRRAGNWWRGFGSVFQLGMRHIAEGTDHLLFLLVLLFPAPLLVRHGKWVGYSGMRPCLLRIAKIVTAFTAGHSLTLAAGALNLVHVPGRPIEVLIAASILVSAVHALRPLFPGREALLAGGFGLVHGMAFATTLAALGLGRWDRVASILGFNLGIEAMQLIVVAIALPSLLLLSRTILYPGVRIGGALLAGTVAAAWIVQRLWDVANPADGLVMALAQRAARIALGLTVLGIAARRFPSLRVAPHDGESAIAAMPADCLES
jgi:hypothetical protein